MAFEEQVHTVFSHSVVDPHLTSKSLVNHWLDNLRNHIVPQRSCILAIILWQRSQLLKSREGYWSCLVCENNRAIRRLTASCIQNRFTTQNHVMGDVAYGWPQQLAMDGDCVVCLTA